MKSLNAPKTIATEEIILKHYTRNILMAFELRLRLIEQMQHGERAIVFIFQLLKHGVALLFKEVPESVRRSFGELIEHKGDSLLQLRIRHFAAARNLNLGFSVEHQLVVFFHLA